MKTESTPVLDPTEAPEGYYAAWKPATIWGVTKNLCEQCDWRKTCQDPKTDLLAYGHRCMSYQVVALRDGKTYQRRDKCSVLFKRKPATT